MGFTIGTPVKIIISLMEIDYFVALFGRGEVGETCLHTWVLGFLFLLHILILGIVRL